jgi:hypothetical protein
VSPDRNEPGPSRARTEGRHPPPRDLDGRGAAVVSFVGLVVGRWEADAGGPLEAAGGIRLPRLLFIPGSGVRSREDQDGAAPAAPGERPLGSRLWPGARRRRWSAVAGGRGGPENRRRHHRLRAVDAALRPGGRSGRRRLPEPVGEAFRHRLRRPREGGPGPRPGPGGWLAVRGARIAGKDGMAGLAALDRGPEGVTGDLLESIRGPGQERDRTAAWRSHAGALPPGRGLPRPYAADVLDGLAGAGPAPGRAGRDAPARDGG